MKQLYEVKESIENYNRAKETMLHWKEKIDVADEQGYVSLMTKNVTLGGETYMVREVVDQLSSAQQAIDMMTYDRNDRETRDTQRQMQGRLNELTEIAEKAIEEVK